MITPISMNELELFIKTKQDTIKQGINDSISKIEKHFNIKLTYDLTEVGNDIIIKGVEDYSFSVSKWFQSKIKPNNLVKFYCTGFPFTLPNSHKSIFFITFNDDFEVEKFQFRTSFLASDGTVNGIKLFFNRFLDLDYIENSCIPSTGRQSSTVKTSAMLCPFSDEVVLFKLSHNKNEEIKELLPEYHIPSVYDFNSVEFTDRLKVYSMLTL